MPRQVAFPLKKLKDPRPLRLPGALNRAFLSFLPPPPPSSSSLVFFNALISQSLGPHIQVQEAHSRLPGKV